MTSTVLTIADLNTTINHEPRVADLKLGFSLGMKNPASAMRQLIGRHREALERFGAVSVTVTESSDRGGRPGQTYWLNKRQALFICTKSEAPLATETTISMVEVFDCWQSGQLATVTPPALAPSMMYARVGQRHVLVDYSDFQIGAGDQALVCDHAGKVSIVRGPLAPNASAPWLGARSVHGHWQKSKAPPFRGISRERNDFTVLGRLVQHGERRRRMIAAA